MPLPSKIAIDGPASSGKSTLALLLANKLDYLYFDTGVMYRAVTWAGLEYGLDMCDEPAVTALAERIQIDVRTPSKSDGRPNDVFVLGLFTEPGREPEGGFDVTWAIREARVEAFVSVVSAYAGVRSAMTLQQRRVGQRGQVVMVGRDIGTVVMPDADLKVYLDASAEERARRRTHELVARGQAADYAKILDGICQRDQIDSTRAVAPLRAAEDARILDSDHLNAAEVFDLVMRWITQYSENH